jgi:3-oxoacyl-[acyl-carrier protein] reductase
MRACGAGEIVNVSSIAGVQGGGSSIAYAAAKAGMNNMTANLARVLGPEIRVNGVAPGFIDSRWWREMPGTDQANYERVRERVGRSAALKRVTTPEDVAQLIVSLITGADLVTGQTIVIDGGSR